MSLFKFKVRIGPLFVGRTRPYRAFGVLMPARWKWQWIR